MAGHDLHRPLDVKRGHDVTVATVMQREILDDAAVDRLGQQLRQIAEQGGGGQLLLNMGNVEHLSSAALAGFIALDRRVKQSGGELCLYNLRPVIHKIFQATNLDRVLKVRVDAATLEPSVPPRKDTSKTSAMGKSASTVVLCDPQRPRATRIVQALSKKLDVLWIDDWGSLDEHCRHQWTAAVLAPLEHDAGRATPNLWHFLQRHGSRQPVVAFADDDGLTLETYCRTLESGVRQILDADAPEFLDRVITSLLHLVEDRRRETSQQDRCMTRLKTMGIIGVSSAMKDIFRRVMRAAEFSDLPVLVMGETGTGKQRIAEAVHSLDEKRSQNQLVTLDCGSISEKLAESQLFGHTKGAFSGAEQERLGLFRTANGGTMLLDEIGELPLQLQPKLLRVLQECRLLPVGADYEHRVDVRIVAATNRPLARMVREGEFRNDLYQRLNVLCIEIPPLRERLEDVQPQAEFFLKSYRDKKEHRLKGFSPRVLETLRHLSWQGNTRQLEFLVREIVAHRPRGPRIEMEDLPRWVIEEVAQVADRAASSPPASGAAAGKSSDALTDVVTWAEQQDFSLSGLLEQIERRMLQRALAKHDGNRTRVAESLGISRPGLLNKLRKHKLK